MPIDCSCDVCGKQYKLQDKLAGKTVRCKACGENFVVPRVSELVAAADAAPSAPVAAMKSAGPSASGDRYCPQCGNGIRHGYVVCTNCGYNLRTGELGRTVVEKRQEVVTVSNTQVARKSDDAARRYDGTRVNTEYQNGFLRVLEFICVRGTGLLIALLFIGPPAIGAFILANSAIATAAVWGRFIGVTFATWIVLAIFLALNVWFNDMALNTAGRLMKFELPEDLGRRVLATKILSSIVGMPILLIAALSASAATTGTGQSAEAVAAAMVGAMLFSLLVMLVAQVFFTWFLLRLRVLEAIVAFIFIVMADIATGVVWFLFSLLLGAILKGIFGPTANP